MTTQPKVQAKENLPTGLYRRGRILWVHYRDKNGERHQKSAKTADVAEAELFRASKMLKASRGEGTGEKIRDMILIKHLLRDSLKRIEMDRSAGYYESAFHNAKIAEDAFGELKPTELTTDHMLELKRRMIRDGYEKATVNHVLGMLRIAFRDGARCTPQKVVAVPQFPMFPKAALRVRTNFCLWPDYERLRDAIDPSLKTLVVVLYHLGLRCGEALGLTWDQIEFYADGMGMPGVISLKPNETKNHEARTCFMYGDLAKYLKLQKRMYDQLGLTHGKVFFWFPESSHIGTTGGTRGTPGAPIRDFRTSWEHAVKAARLDGLIPHDMRRSAVTNMVRRAGMTREEAKRISGHKTDSMLLRYSIMEKLDLEAGYSKMQHFYQAQQAAARQTAPVASGPVSFAELLAQDGACESKGVN